MKLAGIKARLDFMAVEAVGSAPHAGMELGAEAFLFDCDQFRAAARSWRSLARRHRGRRHRCLPECRLSIGGQPPQPAPANAGATGFVLKSMKRSFLAALRRRAPGAPDHSLSASSS